MCLGDSRKGCWGKQATGNCSHNNSSHPAALSQIFLRGRRWPTNYFDGQADDHPGHPAVMMQISMLFHILWPALEAGWGRQAGQTSTTVICALLGTVQASWTISHPPCGFALVYSLLLSITQSHNKGTSERCPDCGNILKSVLKSPSLPTSCRYHTALFCPSPWLGRKLTFHRLLLKLHLRYFVTESIQEDTNLYQRDSSHNQACNSPMSSSQAVWWHCPMRPGCWFWKPTWSLCLP